MTKAGLGVQVTGLLVLVAGVTVGGGAPGLLAPRAARAADHLDGPGVMKDPSTDIGDVYAWVSPDTARTYLAMTVYPSAAPGAKFSSTAAYVFHVDAMAGYQKGAAVSQSILCTFDASQAITCWGPDGSGELVRGSAERAGSDAGITSRSGRMQVFAGLRDDVFAWNQSGFRQTVASLAKALGADPGTCPQQLGVEGAAVLRHGLTLDARSHPGLDSYRRGGDAVQGGYSGNVLTLVIAIDSALLGGADRPVRAVWGSTHALR